jgi:hypothetical protein
MMTKQQSNASTGAKILYRPIGLISSIIAGLAAGAIFKAVWHKTVADGEGDPPRALESEYSLKSARSGPSPRRHLRRRQSSHRPRRRPRLRTPHRTMARQLTLPRMEGHVVTNDQRTHARELRRLGAPQP